VSESNATLATGGSDLVNSFLANYTLTANVENLRLLAPAPSTAPATLSTT
jgi:serralysin